MIRWFCSPTPQSLSQQGYRPKLGTPIISWLIFKKYIEILWSHRIPSGASILTHLSIYTGLGYPYGSRMAMFLPTFKLRCSPKPGKGTQGLSRATRTWMVQARCTMLPATDMWRPCSCCWMRVQRKMCGIDVLKARAGNLRASRFSPIGHRL